MKEKWQNLKKISLKAKKHSFLAMCFFCLFICVLVCIAFVVNYLFTYNATRNVTQEPNSNYKIVEFSDEAFENAIRDVLKRPDGNIYMEELEEIESLSIYGHNDLIDINDLKLFPYLHSLTINNCSVYDISPIKSLVFLEYLSLPNNNIKDFSSLCELDNLQKLDLSGNSISSIPKRIQDMRSLIEINLSNNRISNLINIGSNVQILYMNRNKLTKITDVGEMESLHTASFGDNAITDIMTLDNLHNLEELILYDNCLRDVSFMENNETIRYIDISYNDTNDITELSTCKNLETLVLYGVADFDLTPLQELNIFNSIYLDENFNRENIDFMVGDFKNGDITTKRYLVAKKNMLGLPD